MKSEYRQVVESIISQEAKLAEVKKMHDEALARVAQTAEWVKFNEASLKKYEDRLAEIESGSASDQPKPFIVIDGVTYISEAEVERASIASAKLGDDWKVKTVLLNGKYVATGIGLGVDSQFLASADKFALKTPSDLIRDVLRAELRPGGILHLR
ncbi:hypothetical protein [Pseudomonas chlororaphis]|uniref:hypothetical protein n=1 Tax=Pseudomonas chlororaphis TaxID=587753 RepID=UPI0019288192|nr:hypothetical protein [Pseudomonas chlororaphis]QQX60928.1 hypothetical protein JHW28_10405 [Pseudomonas chlororaphis subsp. aurantiaca]